MPEQPSLMPTPDAGELETLSQLDLDTVPPEKWARGLVEFIEQIEVVYKRDGMDPDEAFRLASLGVRAIAEFRGGRQFYLPRGDALLIALRDATIYHRANRSNIEALASEHGLGVAQVYRICRQQRALHIRKTQGRLFDDQQGD